MEACWAHNPEVDGSKPSSATAFLLSCLMNSVPNSPCVLGSDVCVLAEWRSGSVLGP